MQREFRRGFQHWGRPYSVRVDNGSPWGSCGDLPTVLALWLIGAGIKVVWNPPRRPQNNGVVERSQGLAWNWAEPDQCRDVAELQRRLDKEDWVQRERFPYGSFRSRLEAYPALHHSGRAYTASWERTHWSWDVVLSYLGEFTVPRRVDRSGKIGVYNEKLYVGTVNQGKDAVVHFDAGTSEWVISEPGGVEWCRRPLTQFDAGRLRNLRDQ